MTQPESPFDPAVRDAAAAAADPTAADRLTGLRSVLSTNGLVAPVRLATTIVGGAAVGGIIGNNADRALIWLWHNQDVLKSLAASHSDDVYWWVRTTLDRIAAFLARGP